MSNEEIVRELKQKRAGHIETRDFAAREIAKLDAAIAGLTGENLPAAAPGGLTVPEMVLACCQEFQKQNPPAGGVKLVITNENMDDIARTKFPASVKKIKQGRSNAIVALLKKNKLVRAPGGVELVP